jgi:aspartate/methionine/tyrosine aminotransferase
MLKKTSSRLGGLTVDTMNQSLRTVEYAVRGPIPTRAAQLDMDLKSGKKLPFDKIIYCNIGNPQALQQKPLTYFRDVLALCSAPHLLQKPDADLEKLFPRDAIARARAYQSQINGSGAYTDSAGYGFVRKTVCNFVEERDQTGFSVNPSEIFLTNGASRAVQMALSLITNNATDGVMLPIPQYPLYSATLHMLGSAVVPYELDEASNWGLTTEGLEKSLAAAKAKGINTRGIVIINPGNPTGQVLSYDTIHQVIEFARRHDLAILADEVYQENIYGQGQKFHSFREVLLKEKSKKKVPLFSFHSTSKGILGECGRRGGYLQFTDVPADVAELFQKAPSINLCSNVGGQIMTDLMLRPPRQGEESFASYKAEYDSIYQSLKRRAVTLVKQLNAIEGIKSNPIEGAMYAFPSLNLPSAFVAAARKDGKAADSVWCMRLLEEEGVVVVPGSGFGQVEGTWHFRTTILPPEDQMADVTRRIAAFQKRIIEKYGNPQTFEA